MPPLEFPDSPDVGDTFVDWIWDGVKWVRIGSGTPIGIPEAPNDGQAYARKNMTWIPIVDGGLF